MGAVRVDGHYLDYSDKFIMCEMKPCGFLIIDNANWYLPCQSKWQFAVHHSWLLLAALDGRRRGRHHHAAFHSVSHVVTT
jgi:hypothetical protein